MIRLSGSVKLRCVLLGGAECRLASALLISRSEMNRRYGTRSSRLGYLVLRLWRPLDLVRKFFRHVRMYLRYRLRARRLRGRSFWDRRDDQLSPQG